MCFKMIIVLDMQCHFPEINIRNQITLPQYDCEIVFHFSYCYSSKIHINTNSKPN